MRRAPSALVGAQRLPACGNSRDRRRERVRWWRDRRHDIGWFRAGGGVGVWIGRVDRDPYRAPDIRFCEFVGRARGPFYARAPAAVFVATFPLVDVGERPRR